MIVADTNLVAYLLIDGTRTEAAKSVLKREARWFLPAIWRSEFLNVLTTTVRANVITIEQARDTWHIALALFAANEVEPSGIAVLDTAADRNLSAYDAQFVVAAIDLGAPLVTSDRRLLAACSDVALTPEQFLTSQP